MGWMGLMTTIDVSTHIRNYHLGHHHGYHHSDTRMNGGEEMDKLGKTTDINFPLF
jgi:hypothetical protein